jgi:hypothetical protein
MFYLFPELYDPAHSFILGTMEDDAEILRKVAHDYVSWNGTVLAALAALLDDIEIAAGLEDIFSINAFVDIARTVLGNAES